MVRLLPVPWVCQTTPPRSSGRLACWVRCEGAVDGDELLVAADLADGLAALDLEDDEVPDEVEEVAGLEQAVEEHVLRGGLPAELLARAPRWRAGWGSFHSAQKRWGVPTVP